MKTPYEIHDNYACPKCGETYIIGREVEYGVYVPECSKCGFTGTIHDFLKVKEESSVRKHRKRST